MINSDGVGQDEDQGQLGAWYVMASIGLFDVQGHTANRPSFQFGSPLFDKVIIALDSDYYTGNELIIETVNQKQENLYVQSLSWNNKKVEDNWMYRDELMNGGVLKFNMGDTPNMNWGIKTKPPSMQQGK